MKLLCLRTFNFNNALTNKKNMKKDIVSYKIYKFETLYKKF